MLESLRSSFGSCWAAPHTPLTGNNSLEQVDRNLAPESYELYRKLTNIEPDGRRKEFVLFTVKKGKDKIAGIFVSPCQREGAKHAPAGREHVA